ncbi:MAG TPA: RnfABCDGE type electron transport complex subunit D [Bacteroidales bacterium]|nr:RnfABCDGE type electron transport complex subunit D [Bacteroidales bacterium]HNQ84237.1 RnfABCDGE type electron transport complex subunit D [Bacteroidales bacterium]HOX76535.1 RnfABCDGE type electron transport complex subunit D [Bacteroidales bacterium]HPI86221.1 RnfABCDGE type electron transport complex subunit D [Bacteroidales bacterium]
MSLLTVSGSPHIHSDQPVPKIMYGVVIAMIPAMLVSFYFFGLGAAKVMLTSILACLFFEWVIQKYLLRGPLTINDGSALVTGVLLAFNVPSSLPVWMTITGAFVAIAVAKMSFGGLGQNPFNPALVGRVFLLMSFPVQMTTWPIPKPLFGGTAVTDAISGPTTLGIVKEGLDAGKTVSELLPQLPTYAGELLGNQGGSLGEVSAIALLIGAAWMFWKKIITWHIPVSYILAVVIFSGIFWLINPEQYLDPVFHLITGGMMLGVFYMATDMVSSPINTKGMLIFGAGCGILTMIIRLWGGYPEGVSFAILIMNAFTPLINRSFKPRRFGVVKPS